MLLATVKCLKHLITLHTDLHLPARLDKISSLLRLVPPNVTVSQFVSKPNVFSTALHIWSPSVSAGLVGRGVKASQTIYMHRHRDRKAHSGDAFHLVPLTSTNDWLKLNKTLHPEIWALTSPLLRQTGIGLWNSQKTHVNSLSIRRGWGEGTWNTSVFWPLTSLSWHIFEILYGIKSY